MTVDQSGALATAFDAYVDAQRRLLRLLAEPQAAPGAAGLAMAAELDRLTAAVRQELSRRISRNRGDPGE